MGYKFREGAPEISDEKLGDWLPDMLRFTAEAAGGAVLPYISDGYPVIYPTLKQIAEAKLDTSDSVSWRYLIFSGEHAMGEIETDDQNAPVAFHKGVAKDGLVAALAKAESLPEDYSATVVISPALKLMALWLHRDSEDLFIPFPPNATSLKDYEPISLQVALDVLQPIAKKLLDTPSDSTGG